MNAACQTTVDPIANSAALRAVFRGADRATRQKLVPILPPEEIEFAGIRMFVDPRDNYTDRMIWLDGQPPEMKSLMALTELVEGKNAFILDIGANCGAFTVPLALAAGAGSRVVAFEPNPVMIGRLGHNLVLNGLTDRVRIESCALGDRSGEGMLNLKHGNFGQASLQPIADRARAGETLVPDAMLIETRHAGEWHVDLVAKITALGFKTTLEADGNTLFAR
jgi:FkbM family methyltransferase